MNKIFNEFTEIFTFYLKKSHVDSSYDLFCYKLANPHKLPLIH